MVDKSDKLLKFWCGKEVSARNQNVHPAVRMWTGLEIILCGQLSHLTSLKELDVISEQEDIRERWEHQTIPRRSAYSLAFVIS